MLLIYSCLLRTFRINWRLILLPLNYTLILIKSDLDKLGWPVGNSAGQGLHCFPVGLSFINPIAHRVACLPSDRN